MSMIISKEEFKNTEAILFSYSNLDSQIRQLDIDIENIRLDYISYNGIDYSSEKIGKTYNVQNEVERFVINKEKQIEKLESDRLKLVRYREKIQVAINNFTKEQRVLFNLRYIKKANWVRIMHNMHISKDTYYKLRRELVISAANSMNPKRTLREIESRYKKGYYEDDDWI